MTDCVFATKSGALSGFVLDSLRGLSETIQYGQGKARMAEMNARTDALMEDRIAYETRCRSEHGCHQYRDIVV